MTEQLKAAIVRVFVEGSYNPVGLGFLISEKHVFTCAHVIAQALSVRQDSPESPISKILLDFPLVASGRILSSHVVFWQPVQANPSPVSEDVEDIAILELETSLPDEAQPAHMVMVGDLWKHPFRAFGFPKGYNEGVWAEGELLDRQAKKRVQIEAVKVPGYRVMQGFSGTPVWDSQLNGVVGMVVESDKQEIVKAAYIIPTDVLLNVWPGLSQPYRGLAYFREEDSQFFFGRELYTQQLLESVQKNPLVIVTGPSGSGKSSIIFAGLIPQLRERDWLIITFRPGDRPFYSLAAVLLPLLESKTNETDWLVKIRKLGDLLHDGSLELRDVVESILQKNRTYHRLLLCGDQFEELYTSCQDQEEQQRFLEILLPTMNQNVQTFTLIVALRADFLGRALSDPPFANAFNYTSQELVLKILTSMNQQELQSAIELPANKLHVEIQPGLTKRILDAVGMRAGSLPLLEFALTLLWAKQEKNKLTHAAYDEIGGVENALASYAEESFNNLREKEQQQAQRIFIQLVHLSGETELTRRVATRSEIGENNWSMVTTLANARLVVTGQNEASREETVEVVHEALIEKWKRLRQWIEQDREFRIWQDRLRNALDLWKSSHKDDEALLRGVLLAEAENWLEQRPDGIGEEEKAFILSSRQHYRQEVYVEELTARYAIGRLRDYLAWFLLVLETVFMLRLLLRLAGADSSNIFTSFVYVLSSIPLFPFINIVPSTVFGGTHALEWSTLIGIVSYWLIFYMIRRFLSILISEPDNETVQ